MTQILHQYLCSKFESCLFAVSLLHFAATVFSYLPCCRVSETVLIVSFLVCAQGHAQCDE